MLDALCCFPLLATCVLLQQQDCYSPTRIVGTFYNLPPGEHGFHIHETGDLRNYCHNLGPHFNPYKTVHGGPDDNLAYKHVGDLSNLVANYNKTAHVDRYFTGVSLCQPYPVIGHAMGVALERDDLGKGNNPESKISGNAVTHIDCCVIGWCDNSPYQPKVQAYRSTPNSTGYNYIKKTRGIP